MFVVFLFLFSYGVFCFFDLIIFIELKELKENSKNFKRTQSSLYINSNQFTLYLFKSISLQIKLKARIREFTSNQFQI